MKKTLLVLAMCLLCVAFFALAVSAESVTVVDDGTTELTLGECVIENLDREIPEPTRGFTYVLDTEAKTARITKWASYADPVIGKAFALPSTVTYEENTYTVISFNDVVGYTDNGSGNTSKGNYILTHVYIPDTVISIPNSAFQSCAALEYVYIGSGLETWGEKAFNFAGATAGGYSVKVEEERVDQETGEVTVVTVSKRIEETGVNMGDIKEFVLKSKKVTTMPKEIFHHTEFAKDALIDVDITQFTVFESYCISLNQYALTGDHWFKGTGIRFDVFDLRNATSIAKDAFFYAYGGKVMIINADQAKYFNCNSIRGGGANYYNEDTGNDGCLIICGGKTPQEAKTLTGPIWTSNLYYWYGSTVFMNVVFDGYINAYDGTDGVENQNGYGIDQVNYYFDSIDAMNYYFNSVSATTNAATTYARYAKNGRGYFNVCNGNGTATAYNIKNNADTGAYYLEMWKNNEATPTYNTIVDGKCTESTLCRICDSELVSGIEHSLVSKILYENGYLEAGAYKTWCVNDGCAHSVSVATDVIFTSLGYSVTETGNFGIVQGFVINQNALEAYKAQNPDFAIGIVVSTVENPLDENGEAKDSLKTIKFDITEYNNAAFEIKVSNIGENIDKAIICCGYVIDTDGLHYIDDGKTVDIPTMKSYNEHKEN